MIELGFYSAKEVILQNVGRSRNERTQNPLQGSYTVERDIQKCNKKFMFEDWSLNLVL